MLPQSTRCGSNGRLTTTEFSRIKNGVKTLSPKPCNKNVVFKIEIFTSSKWIIQELFCNSSHVLNVESLALSNFKPTPKSPLFLILPARSTLFKMSWCLQDKERHPTSDKKNQTLQPERLQTSELGAVLHLDVPCQFSESDCMVLGFLGTSEKQYCLPLPPLSTHGPGPLNTSGEKKTSKERREA